MKQNTTRNYPTDGVKALQLCGKVTRDVLITRTAGGENFTHL